MNVNERKREEKKLRFEIAIEICSAPMIYGIIAFLYQNKTNKNEPREKQMSLIERIKQSLKWTHLRSVRIEEVESGSVRVLHKIVLSFTLYLCHVMPLIIRQQHGRSRSSDVALRCLILCSVGATHSLFSLEIF